jgi:large subunit ribosomal protein L9
MAASSFIITLVLLFIVSSVSAKQSSKNTYTKTSFIPPTATGWPSPSKARQQIANGYGTYTNNGVSSSSSTLYAKQKGGGATQPVSKKGKIQVVLLETVPKVGQSGDVVFVSSAIFQNQLKRNNKARLISEEEVQAMEAEKALAEKEILEEAIKTKQILEEAMVDKISDAEQCATDGDDICGVALEMKRKAGPEGNLFGGVNPKMVMDELRQTYPQGSWDGRQVKLTDVKDSDGKDVKKKDIKHIGDYTVCVTLGKGVDVTFILSILEE